MVGYKYILIFELKIIVAKATTAVTVPSSLHDSVVREKGMFAVD